MAQVSFDSTYCVMFCVSDPEHGCKRFPFELVEPGINSIVVVSCPVGRDCANMCVCLYRDTTPAFTLITLGGGMDVRIVFGIPTN